MTELKGIHNTARVFTNKIEPSAEQQITHLLDQEFIKGSKVRIMPDVHAGMGCPIGTTMTVCDKIVPNLVGVDIGCGMETAVLKDKHVELSQLDKAIHQNIPAGFNIRKEAHHMADEIDLSALRCAKHVDLKRAHHSVGTLGGGNHFIELGMDEDGVLHLVVHSGSRNIGKQVAELYQKIAAEALKSRIKEKKIDRVLAHLEGPAFHDYLHDMAIVQEYAVLNRMAMIKELKKRLGLKIKEQFTTTHNYVDLDSMILRKGAISAKKDERVLIPMNMRDGSLICIGKGNPEWNYSAPHGAGRLMSRTAAKDSFTLNQFKKSMEGIYSSTVNNSTLDEAPFAYKPMEEIIANIGDTVDIVKTIKPIYNFKAAE
ncbi:MAG: RtcB family protein [Defluviitaleaceae bacterium]|nr:RtcB family protein [Defluviitaleaceae bacterium]